MLSNFAYTRAGSVKEAVRQLTTPQALIHAGGTDLLGCLRDHVFDAEKIVSIAGIEALCGIRETPEGGLPIGALTTITEVAESPIVRDRFTALAQGASEVASPQLRNQGTLGGNICQKPRCWYYRGEFQCVRKGGDTCFAVGGENQFHCIFGGETCYIVHPSDTAPALVALGASAHIQGRNGEARTVKLENFHVPPATDPERETVLAPHEIVVEISVPPAPEGLKSSYRKVRARRSWDFALAGVALAIQFKDSAVENARVVFSGVAPVPWRSREVEEAITGRELNAEVAARAAEAAVRDARPMEKNAYKVPLLRGVVEEELTAMARRT